MKKIRVGINGFGRIGRAFFRATLFDSEMQVVAINDLAGTKTLAYLLSHDSIYGELENVSGRTGKLITRQGEIPVSSVPDPAQIPWDGVDIVVECTGRFTEYSQSSEHLHNGVKHVVISAPGRGEGVTALVGINEHDLSKTNVSSNASCTTNAVSPILAILSETVGIKKSILSTVHAYTASQSLVDNATSSHDLRRMRAAAENIIPTTTGSASSIISAMPDQKNQFDAIAIRVPAPAVSLIDLTLLSERPTSIDEINVTLATASTQDRWQGIFTATDEPLVSSDIIGNPYASIADLSMTNVVGGDLIKVFAWYDNEFGYANTLLRHVISAAKHLPRSTS